MQAFSKLISFDLQGTVSSSEFSNEFWQEVLPKLYADKHKLSYETAKQKYAEEFKKEGRYHELYYDHRLQMNQLLDQPWDFQSILKLIQNKPRIDEDIIKLIGTIPNSIPIIIVSATTRDFIEHELGHYKILFMKTYSTIDDFMRPGKPKEIFKEISTIYNVIPEQCLHIGDCIEMDVNNPIAAGWMSYHWNKQEPREYLLKGLEELLKKFLNKH